MLNVETETAAAAVDSSSKELVATKKSKPRFALFRYPKAVFFCLGNEFSERFSFYGMTAILILYLHNVHGMDESEATLTFHTFIFVAYFAPLLGSIVADGFLGRYRVILYVSFFYCFGHLLITLGAIDSVDLKSRKILDLVGLFIVALSTGGIKPCVISFAADQFPETQIEERKQFFSFFYFSINSGALLATVLTPIFRTELSYAVAFGVPALFMALALTIFICGRPFYVIENKKGENVVFQAAKCVGNGLIKTVKNKGPPTKGGHWLDHSIPVYGHCFVEDIKNIPSIMLLYIPLIFFWALFLQQGSTWVLQANRMNGRWGRLTIVPEQIGVINPILIIFLIPLFEKFVYPALTAKSLLVKPLQRISFGGILVALSFFIAGFIQLKINKTMVALPEKGEIKYTFTNMYNYNVNLTTTESTFYIAPGESKTNHIKEHSILEFQYDNDNSSIVVPGYSSFGSKGQFIVFWNTSTTVSATHTSYTLEKTENSNAKFYILFHPFFNITTYYRFRILVTQIDYPNNVITYTYGNKDTIMNFFEIKQASIWGGHVFNLSLEICVDNATCTNRSLMTYETLPGEVKGLAITDQGVGQLVDLVPSNTVHILWQVPQYVIITVAEIFFSISGLEFSYSQAAPSMKSLIQALWLMTSAFGNVVDIAISGSGSIENKATEFFVYACLMILVIGVFIILSHSYRYADKTSVEMETTGKKS